MTQDNLNAQKTDTNSQQPHFAVVAQFLKDLSFECPKPNVGINEKDLEMNVEVGLSTKKIADDAYEVSLMLKGNAHIKNEVVFVAEVNYAGHFVMQNIPLEQLDMLIGIESPALLFPFARKILMNAISDAGFRSPMIEPINFAHLYMQAKTQKQQAPEEQKKIEEKH